MKYLLQNQESERIKFRDIRYSDFDKWLEFYKNPITNLHWEGEYGLPEIECQKWYESQFYRYENGLGGMNTLIEKNSGALLGHCGILVQSVDNMQELEVGYSLLPKYWNRGFASEAAIKCRDQFFLNNWGNSLISIISTTNVPSEKVARKNGMSIEKQTVYKKNQVNIYRINKLEWSVLYTHI